MIFRAIPPFRSAPVGMTSVFFYLSIVSSRATTGVEESLLIALNFINHLCPIKSDSSASSPASEYGRM